MKRLLAFLIAGWAAMAATAKAADALVGRVEVRPIASQTLSDAQFLRGEEGKPVTVAGELRIPDAPGRLPAVVLIHGSGGPGANIPMWESEFNHMGIATFALDGFTGRGIVQTSTDQAQLGRLNLILDAYGALAQLAKHPRIDPNRIVLMGFSRGGQATLYASLTRFNKLWNKSGAAFAAYIPFYPDCMTHYIDDDKTAAPIRMFHGQPDDYNPAAPCTEFMGRLKAAGADVTQTIYPDAAHGFDAPNSDAPVQAAKSQTVRACRIREETPGVLIDTATGQPFAYTDACVQLGPHVGGNAKARAQSIEAVEAFVSALFEKK
ncbi:MAG: dienelactone hydrolase family protein [Hyphomicrobiales bacterium]|nr:dienelactone hydrolase family protein [Hyphomicrobiales bacterium]